MLLVEILLATALFVGGAGALLFGVHYAMSHAEYLRQAQIATNAAQGALEQLMAADVDAGLRTHPGYDGTAPYDQTDTQPLDRDGNAIPDIPNGRISIQIRPVPLNPDPPTIPNLLDLHVAVCWTHRGRTIGEGGADAAGAPNCRDDAIDPDLDVESPVMVTTRVARK